MVRGIVAHDRGHGIVEILGPLDHRVQIGSHRQ